MRHGPATCDCHGAARDSQSDARETGFADWALSAQDKGRPLMIGKLLVVGSVALDTVRTPFGEATEVLGGSATFFSVAASYFTTVELIAVIGEDFPEAHLSFLKSRHIDVAGLEQRPGQTFRWKGEYSYHLNEAKTLDTRLNVFETFRPKIPESYRSPDLLFLG